ncbi:amino acid adenylation domain-containing protein [Chryseobacterium sp. G0240]|uniref:non-ribosomal peptide synthetase n=1 Tax=Chryseobacterium sp. G0240 TaxID=2487066 RepID=UPI000F456EBF|nr:non-ribosomal peptide synthetase [Chryseobacterium sp. G0240]ROI04069.1 amino acid adenylation domain-containing protein [Chryseobacterium sp. G0240]
MREEFENTIVGLNNLRKYNCSIWIEDTALKVNFPQNARNNINKEFLQTHGKELFTLLKYNDIYSQSAFNNTVIFKYPGLEDNGYPLSHAQDRLWYIEESNEDKSTTYSMPFVLEMVGSIDKDGIRYAVNKIVDRHEILRTVIKLDEKGKAYQKVCNNPLVIDEYELASDQMASEIKKEILEPFDLSSEYPIRVKIYNIIGDTGDVIQRVLFINVHHIAGDGWSLGIFENELDTYYDAYIRGDEDFNMDPLPIQYKDFAFWQKEVFSKQTLEDQYSYWHKKLEGFEPLKLPTDYISNKSIDYVGSSEAFSIPVALSDKIRQFVRTERASMHTVLLCGISVLLSKYSGMEDIILGSPIANRHYKQLESLIGFFVNMQVNRVKLNKAESFIDLVQRVHADQIEMQSYQDLPFDYLVNRMNVERDMSKHPIFQTSFVVQSFRGNLGSKNFKTISLEEIDETSKFDLSIYIDDSRDEIYGTFTYFTGLFRKETIQKLISKYMSVLETLIGQPSMEYGKMSLLDEKEFNQIVHDFNTSQAEYPKDKTIIELFEKQVEKTPENIAVVFEDIKLTYRELNERSNQLGAYLRLNYNIEPDNLITVEMERNERMIIAILGILKSGAAYVPIDPDYPQDRKEYIEQDAECKLTINDYFLGNFEREKENYPSDNLPVINKPESLAYVIYTSGTTGHPKGVMIENKSVVNLCCWHIKAFKTNETSKAVLFSGQGFDASVWEKFPYLLSGGSLYPLSNTIKYDINKLNEFYSDNLITHSYLPPVVLKELFEKTSDSNVIFLSGGESLENIDIKNHTVYNNYGPTENSVVTSYYKLEKNSSYLVTPIGIPISNTQIYILDDDKNIVPVGVRGKMYVSGEGLSRGYLNNPQLTSEKFIDNPFGHGTKMYDTGDLARWLPDGNIEFLGRKDLQIKILGHRIEIEEIEKNINSIQGVNESCVIKNGGSEKNVLMAYYTKGKENDNEEKVVNDWEKLYDINYKEIVDVENNYHGWNSYIKNQPFTYDEMENWRNDTINKIRTVFPKTILEVGVGNGLLMFPLLKDDINEYVGIDFSKEIINKLKVQVNNDNVLLLAEKADNIDKLPGDKSFDLIIINSVIQYFPNIQYLNNVLFKCIAKGADSNFSIFLGDIRNYNLHKQLVEDRFNHVGKEYLENDVLDVCLKESELLITPEYFKNLECCKGIKVTILEKANTVPYELSKYRYDVVINVDRNEILASELLQETLEKFSLEYTDLFNVPYLNQLSFEDYITEELRKKLPVYMIPKRFQLLNQLPKINGKLDRKKLQQIEISKKVAYESPRNEKELKVCNIWEQILKVEKVGITDDFFELGGNSILATSLIHSLNNFLDIPISIGDIFKHNTIKKLFDNKINVKIKGETWEL